MSRRIVMPTTSGGTYHSCRMKRMGGELKGTGTGSFLLDGGMGGQNSYPSLAAYVNETNVKNLRGSGLEKLSGKISGLSVLPKKKKNNIKFEL